MPVIKVYEYRPQHGDVGGYGPVQTIFFGKIKGHYKPIEWRRTSDAAHRVRVNKVIVGYSTKVEPVEPFEPIVIKDLLWNDNMTKRKWKYFKTLKQFQSFFRLEDSDFCDYDAEDPTKLYLTCSIPMGFSRSGPRWYGPCSSGRIHEIGSWCASAANEGDS